MQVTCDKLRDSDRQNELLRVRLADCEQIIDKFSEEIRQLEVLIDRKAREQEVLDRENKALKQELDEYRQKDAKYCQVRVTLEQESQRRVASDAEADRLRFQHAQLQQSSSLELSNLRKALDDLRFQNDENISTINLRNEQLAMAQRETVEVK